ncbi:MAG: RagB/SusD family nutrient uptake outer membrane protein [Bacteroidales bacterium]|nr:RagB/SusD family nutrient uptake outer membrane protein [Bacteroidales bacterium]
MKKYLIIIAAFASAISCDFLDELPDSRAELTQKDNIAQLLVTAYPDFHPNVFTEMMSDNCDDFLGEENIYGQRYTNQYGLWQDDTESEMYDNPKNVWEANYAAIAAANQALVSMEELGGGEEMDQYRGEALMIRAFCHFTLATLFCMPYNPLTADTQLGIPYSLKPETQLNPQYQRGTLAQTYALIDADIQAALPLMGDNYNVPKYHFTREAALGFATRFYLFYQKWDKVIEYADIVLGDDPTVFFHNWAATAEKTLDFDVYSLDYVDANLKANLLLATGYSLTGVIFGPYATSKRFSLTSLTDKEVCEHQGPWGLVYDKDFTYKMSLYKFNTSTYSFTCVPKYPYLFQYSDAVAGIGYPRSVFPLITGEEVLLNRAEARILKGRFDTGLKDLFIWQSGKFKKYDNAINAPSVEWYYSSCGDYDPIYNTQGNRQLHPQGFTVEPGEMFNCIQCLLQCRRINFVHDGMRWFDTGRYGITLYRRLVDKNGQFTKVEATLEYNDPRRAIQIPQDVVAAGLQPNPRD